MRRGRSFNECDIVFYTLYNWCIPKGDQRWKVKTVNELFGLKVQTIIELFGWKVKTSIALFGWKVKTVIEPFVWKVKTGIELFGWKIKTVIAHLFGKFKVSLNYLVGKLNCHSQLCFYTLAVHATSHPGGFLLLNLIAQILFWQEC